VQIHGNTLKIKLNCAYHMLFFALIFYFCKIKIIAAGVEKIAW